ncbi:MAG: RNA 2',3'-cyclic phosphodiesterase [Vicinamibacterales bacterium]
MSGQLRLFVAVELGPAVVSGVADAVVRGRAVAPRARWVAGDAVHLTLVFLGATAAGAVGDVIAAVRRAAGPQAPFDLVVTGAGTFGRPSCPRVLWLGIGGDVAALAALQGGVARALVPLGVPLEDRAFQPHVTLARARDPRGDRDLARARERLGDGVEAGGQHVSHLALVESRPGAGGPPRYAVLAAVPLGTSAA